MPNSTNGVIVLSDSFATSIFKQSFLRVFSKDDQDFLHMGFNATFDVQVLGSTLPIVSYDLTHRHRPPKNSEFLASSGTPYLPARNQPVWARPRSVLVKHRHGN